MSHRGQKRGSHRRKRCWPQGETFQQGTAHGVRGHNDRYFDNNSTNAFENMVLDVKAFAIQSAGFTSDEAGQKAAFAEVLGADDVFGY